MYFVQNYLITLVISIIACLLSTPLIIKLANYKGWVVKPRNDRWHKKPTALMGGISIFISFSLAMFYVGFAEINWMYYAACCLMFAIGLIDDLFEIKPIVKLLAQIICSFILVYNGLVFGGGLLGWAGIPLTFIWVIGITNAINLLDNMDGLAAGIATIIAIISGVLGVLNGQLIYASMAFALGGATLGFLVYNFKPAKIFMGDSGSLFIGFTLSFLSIAVQNRSGSSASFLMLLVPISLMAIPIMDTTLVTIKRLIAGRRIDQGGKDHTSHRLVALGLTEQKAVLGLYFISAIWGVLCIFMYNTTINNLFLTFLMLTIFSVIFSLALSKVRVYNESEEKLTYLRLKGQEPDANFVLRFFLLHKKLIIGLFTDILIIYSAFLISASAIDLSKESDYVILATFICVKISIFYLSNLYYRMWRYMEVLELVGYFTFIFLSSLILLAIVYFKGRTETYTIFFFLVDFLLTFIGIIFTRVIYRWLNDLISKNRQFEKKVIIYGAGGSGYLLMKELLQNHKHELKPVGWIDDDYTKHNMFLSGTKIFGGADSLLNTCERTKATMVMISTDEISLEKEDELRQILTANSIDLGRFSMKFNYSNLN